MSEWKKCKLGDVVEFNPVERLTKGIVAKKVSMDKLVPNCRDIPEYEFAEFNGGTKFRNNDTIMARITPCLENGKIAQVRILDDGEIGFGSTEYIVFRAKKDITDADYIYYLVTSPDVKAPAIKSMVGSSGRQRVQTDVVQNIDISLPPLAEQKKIAAVLKCLDDKIELNRKMNKNLEEQARAVFNDRFGKYSAENLPDGWRMGKLGDLGTIVAGGTPSKKRADYFTENGIAWITPKDLSITKAKFTSHGEIDITELGYKNSNAKIMPKGTVLFSSRAPIGYISIAQNEVCTNQGFKSIVPNKNIGTAYVYYTLKNNVEIIENRAGGSTFKEASASLMNSIECIIPDEKSLKQFNELCQPIFEFQESNQQESARLAQIRDILLPKLMSGEMEI